MDTCLLLGGFLGGFLFSHYFPSVQRRGHGVCSPSALYYLFPFEVQGRDPMDVLFPPLFLAFILNIDNIQFESMLERTGSWSGLGKSLSHAYRPPYFSELSLCNLNQELADI